MMKGSALAAAALLAIAGGTPANANTTTTLVTFTLGDMSCTAHVNVFNDPTHGVDAKVLVTANEDDSCQTFIGEGFISKVTIAQGETRHIAIIGGISNSPLISPAADTITFDYPFVTGGQYTVSYSKDGKRIFEFASGTYTVK